MELDAQLGPVIAIVKMSVSHEASVCLVFFLHKCFDSSSSITHTLSYHVNDYVCVCVCFVFLAVSVFELCKLLVFSLT